MNILLLCHEYPPLGGGGGVGAKQYADAWAQKGNHVTVLTAWRRGLNFEEIQNGTRIVRVITIPSKDRATFSIASMFSYIISGFFHILWNKQSYRDFQVINSHFCIPTGLLGFMASKLLFRPHVLTIIGGDIYDPTKRSSPHRHFITRVLNRFLMDSADRVVAISGDTKEKAIDSYRVRKDITVINYGFHPTDLTTHNRPKDDSEDGKYRLVAVGRLIPRKGFEYLIRAMARLPENIVVNIVGDGPLEKHLRTIADENNLNGRVNFTGYVPRERINRYLLNANCFVLPSLHEGLGIVVQEAMQAGLPIVSTDNGGQIDLIKHLRNAILIAPRDVDGLTAGIMRFYTDRKLANSVRRNNRQDIKKHYIEANCEKYIGIFAELAGQVESREVEKQPKLVPLSVTEARPNRSVAATQPQHTAESTKTTP